MLIDIIEFKGVYNMKKIMFLIALVIVTALSGCGKKTAQPEMKTEIPVAESKAAEVASNGSSVVQEDNRIYSANEDENGVVTVQEFVYEENELSDVKVTIQLADETEAKEMYEKITNGELKEEYESKYENITLTDRFITADTKSEKVEPMKALDQEQMYLILNSSITTYEVKE